MLSLAWRETTRFYKAISPHRQRFTLTEDRGSLIQPRFSDYINSCYTSSLGTLLYLDSKARHTQYICIQYQQCIAIRYVYCSIQ